jgi:hypothetical protein
VSFYYEGVYNLVPGDHLDPGWNPSHHKMAFEGYYAFGGDWAYQEVYKTTSSDPIHIAITRTTIEGGKKSEVELIPDSKLEVQLPTVKLNLLSLMDDGCAPRYFYASFLRQVQATGPSVLKISGWEPVDGHNCLKVVVNAFPSAPFERTLAVHLWLDIARGGNPLRVEQHFRGEIRRRIDQIRLKEFADAKGRGVWIPISGRSQTFRWNRKVYPHPITEDTFYVVQGSVILNDPRDKREIMDSGSRRIHERAVRTGGSVKLGGRTQQQARMRPAEVRKQLEAQLKEAQQQHGMPDASRSAAPAFWETTFPQWLFGGIGIAVLVLCLVIRARR